VGLIGISIRRWSRLAAIGALVAALGLSACGRRGPLDLPPLASTGPTAGGAPAGAPAPATPEISTGLAGMSQDSSQQPVLGRDGSRPAAPPPSGRRERFFLDWLVD
jgi:predicted small lipoprotein YifL